MKNIFTLLFFTILFCSCGTTKDNAIKPLDKDANQTETSQPSSQLDKKGKTLIYGAKVLSTNFTVPLVRFNVIENTEGNSDAVGNVNFFNSIGAGVSFGGGKIQETRNENNEIINSEFYNTLGIQVGVLFSARTGEITENVFAPTVGVNILNFQAGLGYELGTLSPNQKPLFFTIAYAIPISKLIKGGFSVRSIDPEPIEDSKAFNF